MTTIAFIGLGNMGGPMAANLVKAGHDVSRLRPRARRSGSRGAWRHNGVATHAAACRSGFAAGTVITMLPAGKHVLSVWPELVRRRTRSRHAPHRLLDHRHRQRPQGPCARREAWAALRLDAPVSGGTGGAAAGTLTFMVGGAGRRLRLGRAAPARPWARRSSIAATPAAGQAAKICNNMILGISHDRRRRGLRAGREARPLPPGALRRRLDLLGPVLVARPPTARCPARCRPRPPTAATSRASRPP